MIFYSSATSSFNYFEPQTNDLTLKIPKMRIFLANTILNYIKSNSIENTYPSSKKINCKAFEIMILKLSFKTLLLTYHDVPYYGERETPYV